MSFTDGAGNLAALRLIRLLRAIKLLRVLRLLKLVKKLDELHTLLQGQQDLVAVPKRQSSVASELSPRRVTRAFRAYVLQLGTSHCYARPARYPAGHECADVGQHPRRRHLVPGAAGSEAIVISPAQELFMHSSQCFLGGFMYSSSL